MVKSLLKFVIAVAAVFAIATGVALAGSASFSGTFAGDPTMNVVSISTPNCVAQGTTDVRYDAYAITVTVTGLYSFTATSTGGSGTLSSIYIMDSGFNPTAALGNCLYGANNGTPNGAVLNNANLTAGTPYYLVIFDDTFGQATPGYNASAEGVGDIIGLPGSGGAGTMAACTNPLPAGSVVYNIPAGAPAFFAPDLGSGTGFDIPAGTWYISEFSGDFAKVWVACQAASVWVPANAVAH
jgi:hypothetical protein